MKIPLSFPAPLSPRSWSIKTLQYPLFMILLAFDFYVIQVPSLWIRCLLAVALVASFFIPYIRRFTIAAMPIFVWLITFYACQFIPDHWRPQHIFVNILPTLERILYGASLSEIISQHQHPVLDVLAWIPYGIIHFSFPFVFATLLFVFGPPGCVKVFGKAFGFMNLAGVLTQLLFPTASPWYELSYGSAPADYSIPGQPGGLARIDDILGFKLYGNTFGNSPLVFGAFPSLHSGCATIEMLFLAYLCPKLRILCMAHVMWMWWSTMYLTHHYLIDLVGGSIYAILAYFIARPYLPPIRKDCRTRLDYLNIKSVSFMSFLSSIEMDAPVPEATDIEQPQEEYKEADLVAHVAITMNEDPATVRLLKEPPYELPSLRIDELDHITTGSSSLYSSPASLTSDGTSTPSWSEPSSPRSLESFEHFPFHTNQK
ncbi:uncharacterized protein BYT42DRAFT_569227 [Radiomyces spectabilis]|uniref:uncharacterized protein n=1 Tax=Radiomyces spectabilis TaxID=64574 RepID=UPI00221E64BF|nr:uncharacterized protein BYT42DRAFT_569227 [Radiomyces spectabilis]KAI8379563.1 hypothetical protein BYT42DRAFT_569227 [Radiomyces spectabilis]